MSLEDEIQDELVTDRENILRSEMERVDSLFQIHQDGTVDIKEPYRNADDEKKALIYLIGQAYAFEGDVSEGAGISTSFLYDRLTSSDRTVRRKLKALEEAGLVRREDQSTYLIVPENLPAAIDRVHEGEGNE